MNTKDWKQKELNNLLMEKWGYGKKKEYILDEDAGQRIFAPSHYCAHHVVHEGREAFTIDHNFNESLNDVDELTILKESSHGGKRDKEHPPVKQDEEEIEESHCGNRDEEELEEGEIKNPGKYKTGMEKGYDDDGDGVPDGADSDPKDGSKS